MFLLLVCFLYMRLILLSLFNTFILSVYYTYYESDTEDEHLNVTRYKPERLETLCKATNFSKQEIRLMYQGFKQECPSGVVSEDAFKEIFSQFFPQGDATQYAHYVFSTFKHFSRSSSLNFEQFINLLSSLSRGPVTEKLKWIFDLYDINGDGFISKQEMLHIVSSIYEMLGHYTEPVVHEHSAKEHVERIFHDENRSKSLFQLDTVM
ncbi:A-type potassium channel modulatory protein KCNIP1-like isoform X2 [Tachypleus tridentatus]|uniref:A-type potassium channel modulatory protein KCNIP1-like isoform X2 n=1 Tax=Tachypleus tridentatus TaxID=6853 RepID=UPI003FD00CFD